MQRYVHGNPLSHHSSYLTFIRLEGCGVGPNPGPRNSQRHGMRQRKNHGNERGKERTHNRATVHHTPATAGQALRQRLDVVSEISQALRQKLDVVSEIGKALRQKLGFCFEWRREGTKINLKAGQPKTEFVAAGSGPTQKSSGWPRGRQAKIIAPLRNFPGSTLAR